MTDTDMGDSALLGSYVTIVNTSRADVNGTVGLCKTYLPEKSRYAVHVCTNMFPPTESIMNLKVENIEPAGMVKAKVGGFKNSLVEAAKEPQVKEAIQGFRVMTAELESFLSIYGLTTRTFVTAVLLLLSFHFYFRGLLKTLMLFFLVYYPLMFALPDIRMKKSPLQVLRNIPNNVRIQVNMASGRDIPAWAVTLVFVGVWGLGFKAVVSPSAAISPVVGSAAGADIDKAYAMGFDDGSAGKPFGTSLNTPPEGSVDYDPQVEPKASPFNFSLLMSTGLLVKFAYDAGQDGVGGWNPAMILPNVRANPMKAAMPAFGLYRLVTALRG